VAIQYDSDSSACSQSSIVHIYRRTTTGFTLMQSGAVLGHAISGGLVLSRSFASSQHLFATTVLPRHKTYPTASFFTSQSTLNQHGLFVAANDAWVRAYRWGVQDSTRHYNATGCQCLFSNKSNVQWDGLVSNQDTIVTLLQNKLFVLPLQLFLEAADFDCRFAINPNGNQTVPASPQSSPSHDALSSTPASLSTSLPSTTLDERQLTRTVTQTVLLSAIAGSVALLAIAMLVRSKRKQRRTQIWNQSIEVGATAHLQDC